MLFLEYLNQRQNVEKTRNFNVFQNYTLDALNKLFASLKSSIHTSEKKSPNPSKPIRVSVVGTNGKGSTSHYLACLTSLLGYKVGLYTSPHLLTPLERFQIVTNGNLSLPSKEDVEECFQTILKENHPEIDSLSYFEFLTVFAYRYFQKQNVEVEIWEAGLGGRLDATKLVEADFVVMTKIGLDHSEILGGTREAICQEKLGIIGEKTLALFAMKEEVDSLPLPFQNRPKKEKVPLHVIAQAPKESYLESNFLYAKEILKDLFPSRKNDLESISFPEVPNPKGRMEVLAKEPLIVFDPSHNPDAIQTTTQEFCKSHPEFHLLLGSLPDKDLPGILEVLPRTALKTLFLWEGEGFGTFPEPRPDLAKQTKRTKSESDLVPVFQGRTPLLVLGSFRLYGIVANLIQNTIKM
ncbi:bifunctional folylpolyglutamate synthase/dihydrofolate synthase [Leptospira kemamanensis]|uniref:Bifunctional folylpolyglutamate synthase/dihydrofolate synthase n=1 Tax=Leptospira kemamanensis TaxID=2484942 RepID=A0A4R9JTL8_9LEPT|nr:bifunctional folylpolyglutamate synthase/dihydrofolate synthase [Leptospira kemamanensis]TGL56102.1 bifunctional folylpolyglutamate synthase/dihydrofolate synthase [Leptospira kemamanensis]